LSRQYASQLLFEVKPSRNIQRIIIICALLSLLSILILNIDFIYQLIVFLFLVLLVLRSWKNNIKRNVQWQPDGSWLITQNNIQHKARLQPGSVVTTNFASLKFKLENKKTLTVVIFNDNIDAEKFRQLRVRLKVEGIKPANSVLVNDD